MFAVMGVTGQVGRAVANALLASGKGVRVIVRDGTKAREWADRGCEVSVTDNLNVAAMVELEGPSRYTANDIEAARSHAFGHGMYGELAVAPVHALVRQPGGMTSVEAAGTPQLDLVEHPILRQIKLAHHDFEFLVCKSRRDVIVLHSASGAAVPSMLGIRPARLKPAQNSEISAFSQQPLPRSLQGEC
ncbi:NAD-dependent epimerase/dehydratase family protein [Pseudomonas viridiflava]|uniref:NAD-dependent epimerase/dehydratase family protein n=1 Tax=Pseudomonas viridiflava TaxID=33069 RepID=UPI002EA8D560|nr:NAD-dependent epimerase/dehydratase family protein [Pseudomonas viridiflava]